MFKDSFWLEVAGSFPPFIFSASRMDRIQASEYDLCDDGEGRGECVFVINFPLCVSLWR